MEIERKELYEAERLRASGNWQGAIKLAERWALLTRNEIDQLSSQDLQTKMSFWRIMAVSLLSASQKTWSGSEAGKRLFKARNVIANYYENETVKRVASLLQTDHEGHQYQMRPEQVRDIGKYLTYTAALTGNTAFLNEAVRRFDEAIELAGASAWGVAVMEQEILRRKSSKAITWNRFKEAYETVVVLAPDAGGWDRQAAVSWWYILEAFRLGKIEEVRVGFENLTQATRSEKSSWLKKYLIPDLTRKVMETSRRLTFKGDARRFEF